MSNTISFQCHIQISSKELKKVVGKTLTFMGNSKTIDENGKVVFDCELQAQDKAKSFPITIEDEEYVIVGTGKCNAIAHRDSTNPFCLMFNKDNEASIEYIRIYKEIDKADSDQKEQRDIYTAQVEKPNETTQQSNTNDTHNSQAKPQENQNLVNIEAHLTSGKALKKDIQWGYYIKQSNENLKAKVSIKDLKSFTFVSKDTYNTKVSFDINAKFSYTITENNSQKEVEDYLKEKHQLIIFAYKNNPAYNVGERITHTILTISTLPIIEIGYNTLTLWHNDIKEIFHIDNTIMPHLIKDFTEDTQYTLGYNIQNDYLALKSNNKLYKIYTNNPTQSIQHSSNNTTQQDNTDSIYLKESKDFENLKNTLQLTSQQIYQEVKVYVEINNLRLSGKEWVKEYKEKEGQSEESLLNDLESNFKNNVVTFINVLRNSGASVVVTSTRRSKKRATLMHYAWRIGVSKDITPQQAQIETQKENIPINWIHTDSSGKYSEEISREKALEMKNAYGMRDKASLTSNHILGKAVDMTITWTKDIEIKDKTGKEYTLTPNDGAKCKELHDIGATYGVHKLVKNPPDDPHWSFNGK